MSGMNPVPDYVDKPTYEERSALDLFTKQMRWQDVMKRSYYKYEQDSSYQKGLQVAQSLILEYPEQGEVYRMAGNMCLKMKAYEKAVYYFYKCDQLEKNDLSERQLADARKALSEAGGSGTNNGYE
jgi:tetratricopeptide (TPR) repeat protein